MAFVTEKEELKPGLILFRRGDVDHRMWYCRMKMPKADRYKTVSLKTTDISAARERAFDQDADIRFRIKHDVPVFNRPFRDVAREYRIRPSCRSPLSVVREPRGRTYGSLGHLVHAFIELMNLHDAETQSLNHLHLKAHGIVCC
jgi:hypothetical protein